MVKGEVKNLKLTTSL
uniref:Uncharacterized protein n=1 Tax=Rhizophora mucronata TaxID=61149 RepID=A0A2P2NWD2_RHIMU